MKKHIFFLAFIFFIIFSTSAQTISVSNDKENILYIGIDNPMTIAVENESARNLVIKTDNGSINGTNGLYYFRSNTIGKAEIIIYKKNGSKLKELGRKYFRVKRMEDAIFKIGSGNDSINLAELVAQQYVRAELDGKYGFDLKITVESFTVCIIPSDTCNFIERINIGNKISDEIRNEFRLLKSNDIIIFKKIIVTYPDAKKEISPRMITVK
ncbi:MAG: GldM family protein [Saprospiraceae bacterium]